MTPERWKKIDEILDEVLELPEAEREKFLAEKCGADKDLQIEIQSLLEALEEAEEFIENSAIKVVAKNLAKEKQTAPNLHFIGKFFDSYKIEKLIGEGGMGEVYLAYDEKLKRKVAIKILPIRYKANDERVNRFGREAHAISALNHPNIVTIYDVGIFENINYIATEYVKGKTLRQYVNSGMNLRGVLNVVIQCCDALAAAHDAGIIHRDIKPENIIVRPDGYVKILDFGLAKLTADSSSSQKEFEGTEKGMIIGTPAYMSPEQISDGEVNHRTDLWSIGLILYELLTGINPFKKENRNESFQAILNSNPPPASSLNSEVPVELDRVLIKLLEKEADLSYQSAADVKADLTKIKRETDSSSIHYKGQSSKFTGRILSSTPIYFGLSIFFIVAILAGVLFWNNSFGHRSENNVAQPTSAKEVKVIAVLPFRNFETEKENKILGIGMADAVITKLSHIRSIVVRQTSSVIHFADTTPDATKIGRELNVDAILDGNIQKASGRIRVTVRMYRVSDGALLWADSFDENETDIFLLQDSISERVVNSLSLEIDQNEKNKLKQRYTQNIEAYYLYNKGRFFWNNRNTEDLRKSIDFYEQAIAKDENYSLAYAGMAESYVLLQLFSQSQEKEFFPNAKRAAEKALSIDKDLAEAHTALAKYKEQYEYDWKGAEISFKQAISANPNYATAHQWYGEFLAFMGRTEESIAEVEKAFELDPLSLSTNTARAFPYLAARQYDQAIKISKSALELQNDFPMALYYLGRSYEDKGQYKDAIVKYKEAIKAAGGSTFFSSSLISALVKNGQKATAEKIFVEISRLAKQQNVSKYILAKGLAALGEKEKALDELENAFQERDSLMIVMNIDRNFDDIRNEPRFIKLLNKMNF